MISDFKPNNLLEEKLLALHRKEIEINEFLEMLLDSQVIILADRDVNISGPNMSFNPLAITSPMGYNVLVTFSSIERAKAALTNYPANKFAVAVDTKWFLLGTYDNTGGALIPGRPFGFELPPEGLQQLLTRFGVKKNPAGKTDYSQIQERKRVA